MAINPPNYNWANITIPTNGSSGISITDASATWATQSWYTKQPKVHITDSDIELDGLSLRETMLSICKELQIPTRLKRNQQLEQEFEELQAAAERYRELEKKLLEQKAMWNTLKNTDLK